MGNYYIFIFEGSSICFSLDIFTGWLILKKPTKYYGWPDMIEPIFVYQKQLRQAMSYGYVNILFIIIDKITFVLNTSLFSQVLREVSLSFNNYRVTASASIIK